MAEKNGTLKILALIAAISGLTLAVITLIFALNINSYMRSAADASMLTSLIFFTLYL